MLSFLPAYKNFWVATAILLFVPILPVLSANCGNSNALFTSPKISFDLSDISEEGLIGKEGGLRAVNYEFCIPATPEALREVQQIDSTIQYSRSRGRIGCQGDQYLCIGSTHQQNWRGVLFQLTSLDYVQKIDPFLGE